MKKAADIFYKIGRILTYVGIGVFAALTICGVIVTIVGAVGMATEPDDQYAEYASFLMYVGIDLIAVDIVLTAVYIAMAIVMNIAKRRMAADPANNGPHILMVVFGAISGNSCFIAAGVLSIIDIARNDDSDVPTTAEAPVEAEENKDFE